MSQYIAFADDKKDQLIMCVPGCGGTGKSQLIRAITAYFAQTNRAQKLRKLAPTSVAAAEIEGMTIHSFLGEGRNRKTRSRSMNRPGQMTLENTWRFVEYIILDEMSMVGLSLLARLNKLVATAKHCDPMTTMGGINLILFGDYIQYSPVFDKPLYYNFSTTMANDANKNTKLPTENEIQQKSARALILQINCVVVLEQQMRTKDLAYQALLNRVRNGEGTHEDWLLLRTRAIGVGLHISLNDPPWNEVCYICNVSYNRINVSRTLHKFF
jgi:ATP-dependent exoDNAse (exonuclease V) alpha subunit